MYIDFVSALFVQYYEANNHRMLNYQLYMYTGGNYVSCVGYCMGVDKALLQDLANPPGEMSL